MTSQWTAEDMPNLAGKIVIVTGANSGIGYEMARALSHREATVILACRSKEKGEATIRQLGQEYPVTQAHLMQLDLSSLVSIHHFADEFIHHYDRLDILINNAGIMRTPFGKTVDGFEMQFGTNHLGHFALSGLLWERIVCTPQARVVTVSSWGHHFGVIDFENLNAEKMYEPGGAYAQSKLANLLFTYELQRRFEGARVEAIAIAAHPGWTATNLAVHWPIVQKLTPFVGQKPEMGALPTLYAATAPGVHGGEYYGPRNWGGIRGYPTQVQSSACSYDIDVAVKLWKVSEELTNVRYP
jgi:NAD(P)-dependent dehydrogenase (short-subunit alcohol dehydrogenase family)